MQDFKNADLANVYQARATNWSAWARHYRLEAIGARAFGDDPEDIQYLEYLCEKTSQQAGVYANLAMYYRLKAIENS